jgi:hypothetical protein
LASETDEGAVATALGGIARELGEMNTRLEAIQDAIAERPSRVELEPARQALESIRAKRGPEPSLVEFEGPGGFRGTFRGFSGVTIGVVALVAAFSLGLWVGLR